ncbi:MAG: pirin family protein [Pseudomonadota bacterium]|nr:MAG: quercetin 2,3-dioxygenase [Pseudomonadota bacterium]
MDIRRANQRGYADHGWLRSFHTFSFADYYDPAHMGFRALRVINEDRVQPGRGFPTHPHRDMEILTYVLEGALEHRDSMGNGSVIRPGEAQCLSAGTGITHSEFNASREEIVHFLQIWILPNVLGAPPRYQQRAFPVDERRGKLRRIASPDGRDGSLTIRQDANVDVALLDPGQAVRHVVAPERHAWIHVARGEVDVGGVTLGAGDAAAYDEPAELALVGKSPAEVLVFDLS